MLDRLGKCVARQPFGEPDGSGKALQLALLISLRDDRQHLARLFDRQIENDEDVQENMLRQYRAQKAGLLSRDPVADLFLLSDAHGGRGRDGGCKIGGTHSRLKSGTFVRVFHRMRSFALNSSLSGICGYVTARQKCSRTPGCTSEWATSRGAGLAMSICRRLGLPNAEPE